MRDLTFDDLFWRDTVEALRAGGGAAGLSDTYAGFAALIDDISADAAAEPTMVGVRLVASGKNPRLFSFLLAAFLAHEGFDTLLLDLSPELRWLEHLLGGDFKEGVVDHLQYGVDLERCEKRTAWPRLSVLSGGAYFLAGSPLDDAPGLRGVLDRLRRSHQVVVVTLPQPVESADAAGVTTLCGTVVTVEEPDVAVDATDDGHTVVRFAGDPQAAWELAQLTQRFLGPLPALLGGGSAPTVTAGVVGTPEVVVTAESEDVDFLTGFEGREDGPATREPPRQVFDSDALIADERGPLAGRRSRWIAVAAVGIVAAVLVFGLGTRWFGPLFAGRDSADPWPGPEAETIALAEPGESPPPARAVAATVPGDVDTPGRAPTPLPFSLHVGSYQNDASALRLVDAVERTGRTAYLAPVMITDKGLWHRVYVGTFADREAARAALDRLVEEGLVEEGAVRSVPWAFSLGRFAGRAEAELRRAQLRHEGISTYVLGTDQVELLSGGYESEAEASVLAGDLERIGQSYVLQPRAE